jgi:hypothetical protein
MGYRKLCDLPPGRSGWRKGYEVKDEKDDLKVEMNKKFAAGYPQK